MFPGGSGDSSADVPMHAEASVLEASDSSEDRAWVARAQAGERQALDWLVRRHAPLVQRLLTRMLGKRQDVEDLVQNTFLETMRALPSFRHESALSTFIAGIAVRVARRAMRPTLIERFRAVYPDEELSGQSPMPDELLDGRERLERVRRALARVSEPKRVAFLLWALEGMSLPEIAAAMEASVAATRSRIHYAQKELLARAERDPYLREWLLARTP
jgi:RNA polymerase sigma-70 factor, ECF subfamily